MGNVGEHLTRLVQGTAQKQVLRTGPEQHIVGVQTPPEDVRRESAFPVSPGQAERRPADARRECALQESLLKWPQFNHGVSHVLSGIPQIKPTFLEIAPSGIPSNIIPHSKGVKCGLIRSNSPFSYSNHRPAKPKIPKPLVYAQVSPLGTSFATP